MSPKEYLSLCRRKRRVIDNAEAAMDAAAEQVERPPMEKLRTATKRDIVPGVMLWHSDGDDGWFWQVVSEVYGDGYYTAEDGGNYNALRNGWVEI